MMSDRFEAMRRMDEVRQQLQRRLQGLPPEEQREYFRAAARRVLAMPEASAPQPETIERVTVEEPRAMREVHEWREQVQRQTAGLSEEERIRFYAEQAEPLRRLSEERRRSARARAA